MFREIGLAGELGSGMRNTYKYTKLYPGIEPEFMEGNIFRTIIPLTPAATAGPDNTLCTQVKLSDDKLTELVNFCSTPKSCKEMQEFCQIKTVEYFRKHIIKPMLANKITRQTIPEKPNSKNQKYVKY